MPESVPDPDVVKVGPYMTAERMPLGSHDSWTIHSRDGAILALVEWYPRWRQYVLSGSHAAVFSADCLTALAAFMGRLR